VLILYLTAWLILGFLSGSIPFGWIIARVHGIDIQSIGSGSIGATNVRRALGWGWAAAVLALDVLKGLLPLIGLKVCLAHMPAAQIPLPWHPWLLMLTGIAAILGHTYTPWLRFRGGKGIATGLGVVTALMGWWLLAPLATFILVVATTRMVSLGSIFAALSVAAFILSVPGLRAYWLLAIAVPVLVLWTHRQNIERIFAGTESRLWDKRQPQEPAEETPIEDEAD
jgi:glycerol-3-phosphate acyltransferase PlsY